MFLAIFFILTRLFNISLAPIPPYIAEYSIHVIEFLMTHRPGTFYCLFYDLSREFPTNSVFDDLLRTPRLDNVVKYVLDSWFVTNFYVPIPQKPSLVVVYVGESSIPNTVRLMFLIMNPNTKVLVLVNSRWFEPIREMISIFNDRTDGGRIFNKVVYIVAPLTIFHTDLEGRITNVLREFPQPQALFMDNLLDMQGSPIVYSWTDGAVAEDIMWIKETAKYLNATARYEEHLCNRIRTPDCKTKHQFDPNSTILLDHLIVAELSPPAYQTLFVILPDTTVIVVPRGRTINVIEMFLWPFSLEVWSILAGSLIVVELISLIFPRLLKNDPILLILCGFERASLHRSAKWEKLIMFSMIVFFFFMKSAYETRIISYMAQKPSLREIKTVRELVQAGIQIVVNPIRNPYLIEDDEIGSLVVHREKDLGYDGVSAYVGGGRNVEYLLGLPYLYDYQLGRRKYYALQETRGLKVPMFLLFNRALLEHFTRTQRVFFESGLIFKWDHDEARLTRMTDKRFYFRMHGKVSVDDLLKIDDLLPAWIALASGSAISGVVFVAEIAIRRIRVLYRYWNW